MDDDERKQRRRESARQWRERNPDFGKNAIREWKEKNPEKVREQWKRQSARRSAKGPRRRNTQTPCVRCGVLDRMPSGVCKPCQIRRNEERRRKHPELVRQQANERVRRYRERMSPERHKVVNRQANMRKAFKLYGLTQEQYDVMVAEQNNLCAICGKRQKGRSEHLHVDHDHATGKVRALLCGKCNVSIGGFDEDIEIMRRAIAYIEVHRTGSA